MSSLSQFESARFKGQINDILRNITSTHNNSTSNFIEERPNNGENVDNEDNEEDGIEMNPHQITAYRLTKNKKFLDENIPGLIVEEDSDDNCDDNCDNNDCIFTTVTHDKKKYLIKDKCLANRTIGQNKKIISDLAKIIINTDANIFQYIISDRDTINYLDYTFEYKIKHNYFNLYVSSSQFFIEIRCINNFVTILYGESCVRYNSTECNSIKYYSIIHNEKILDVKNDTCLSMVKNFDMIINLRSYIYKMLNLGPDTFSTSKNKSVMTYDGFFLEFKTDNNHTNIDIQDLRFSEKKVQHKITRNLLDEYPDNLSCHDLKKLYHNDPVIQSHLTNSYLSLNINNSSDDQIEMAIKQHIFNSNIMLIRKKTLIDELFIAPSPNTAIKSENLGTYTKIMCEYLNDAKHRKIELYYARAPHLVFKYETKIFKNGKCIAHIVPSLYKQKTGTWRYKKDNYNKETVISMSVFDNLVSKSVIETENKFEESVRSGDTWNIMIKKLTVDSKINDLIKYIIITRYFCAINHFNISCDSMPSSYIILKESFRDTFSAKTVPRYSINNLKKMYHVLLSNVYTAEINRDLVTRDVISDNIYVETGDYDETDNYIDFGDITSVYSYDTTLFFTDSPKIINALKQIGVNKQMELELNPSIFIQSNSQREIYMNAIKFMLEKINFDKIAHKHDVKVCYLLLACVSVYAITNYINMPELKNYKTLYDITRMGTEKMYDTWIKTTECNFGIQNNKKTTLYNFENTMHVSKHVLEHMSNYFLFSSKETKQKFDENKSLVSSTKKTISYGSFNLFKIGNGSSKNISIVDNKKKEELKFGAIGYKAAISENNKPCIVILKIPHDALIASDLTCSKLRTNKCVVGKIIEVNVTEGHGGSIIVNHNISLNEITRDGICPVCCINYADHMAEPCCHNLCMKCWIVQMGNNMKCPYCTKKVLSVKHVKDYAINFKLSKNECKKAYSIISPKTLCYELGQMITVTNFNVNLNNVCVDGIHYHKDLKSTYKWFEYALIPRELQSKEFKYLDTNVVKTTPNYSDKLALELAEKVRGEHDDKNSTAKNILDVTEIGITTDSIDASYYQSDNLLDEPVTHTTSKKSDTALIPEDETHYYPSNFEDDNENNDDINYEYTSIASRIDKMQKTDVDKIAEQFNISYIDANKLASEMDIDELRSMMDTDNYDENKPINYF